MPLDEFTILFDNPTKSFYPGNAVTGRVVVSAPLETKTQGLKIKCYGYAKVHWSETTTKSVGTGSNRRTERVTHNYDATENYFQYKIYVVGDGNGEHRIPPGRNEYPFNFILPTTTLPCSYQGAHGKVVYEVSATIKRSWKFDKDVKEGILMNTVLDLNPSIAEPVQRQDSKHFCCCCCKSGPLGFEITLPKTGFVPGEDVSPSVKLFNESGKGINGTSVSLIQKANFHAERRVKTASNTVAEMRGPGVDPSDTSVWNPIFKIPDVPPTKLGGCGIIDLQYFIHIELHLPGMAVNLKDEIPVMIGTVPLPSAFSGPTTNLNATGYYYPQISGLPANLPMTGPGDGIGFIHPAPWSQIPTVPHIPSAPPQDETKFS